MRNWHWIKREIFFAEDMTNKEFLKLFFGCVVAVPIVVSVIWLVFALGYLVQGM